MNGTSIIDAIRATRPAPGAPTEDWDGYNTMLCSLIRNGTKEEKAGAVSEILEANERLIGRYVGELNFRMYDYCEFEDACHVMAVALAEELLSDAFDGAWDALLFRKALFRARRLLHNGYREGGISISYSRSRERSGSPLIRVVPIEDLGSLARGKERSPEAALEEKMMGSLVLGILKDAEKSGVLSRLDKAVLIAHYVEGQTYRELSRETGILENTISKRMGRALRRLKRLALEQDPDAREYLMSY